MRVLRKDEPYEILSYTDLELPLDEEPSVDYDLKVPQDEILWALADLNKLPEDSTDEEDLKKIDEYMKKYEEELLDYFEDDAIKAASENYEPPEPDWDMMPGGHDDY